MSLPEVAEALNIRLRDVRTLVSDQRLLATRPTGPLSISSDQLVDEDGTFTILGNLRGTLTVLFDAGFTEEEADEWLHREEPELGQTPMSALREGRHRAVRRIVAGLAF